MSHHLDSGCSLQCGATSSCGDCQELGDIDKDIERAEDIVNQAKTRRFAFLARVNLRRDVLTSKLPVEIICLIFEEYVKMHEMEPTENDMHPDLWRPRYFAPIHRRGPLSLGTVCQNWRKIAWSHSHLWKTLVIAISYSGYNMGPVMVSEWLERTGEQQLDIQMVEHSYKSRNLRQMKKNAILIVQALNRVSSRWRSLDFSECPVDVLSELDDTGCSSQSVLRHLSIGYNSGHRHAFGLKLLEKSKHRHRPTHLNLLCAIQPLHFNIEWIRLTHLYLEGMSRKHFSHVLTCTTKSSPALRYLALRLMDNFFPSMDFNEACNFRHPALETLVIHEEESEPETTSWLLSALTLSALQTFKYDGNDMDTDFPVQAFLDLLVRSACSLSTLEVLTPCVDDDDLARMLRATPSVRILKVDLRDDSDIDSENLFNCLSQKDLNNHSAASFLPNLMQLNITANAPRHWRAFIGMFADDPMVQTPEFGQTRPTRHMLQVTFNVYPNPAGGHDMDLMSLSQLAVLWKTHRFYAVLELVDGFVPSMSSSSFLLESYRVGTIGLPRPVLEKYAKLEQYLITLSSLTF